MEIITENIRDDEKLLQEENQYYGWIKQIVMEVPRNIWHYMFHYSACSALAKEAIKQGNYEGLRYIMHHSDKCTDVLKEAMAQLGLETVNALTDPEMSYEEAKARKKKVIITILDAIDTFTEKSLKPLLVATSTEEFDTFCKDNNIDLALPEYKQISALHQLRSRETVQKLNPGANSIVDVVLSRTTIEQDVDTQQIREAYLKISESSTIAKEMLKFLALRITKGEQITIVIEQDLQAIADSDMHRTAYRPVQQMIAINLVSQTKHLTLESSLVHEIGHWFYNNLFHWGSLPLSRECLREAASALTKEERSDANIDNSLTFFLTRNLSQEIECFAKYEEAAKQPLYKAAEIIGVDLEQCAQTVECADLLLMKFVKKYYNQYGVDIEHFRDESFFVGVNINAMLNRITSSTNNIFTAIQKHFLERIFDYALREINFIERRDDEVIIKRAYFSSLYVELIVRGPELATSPGMAEEECLLSSFDKLAEYHNEFASPLVQEEIDAHQAECIENPLLTCIVGL